MKSVKFIILLFCFGFLFVKISWAHPGRTDSSGCHTCRTNCPGWGLSYGEYHCHNGGNGSDNATTIQSELTTVNPTNTPYLPQPTNTPIPTKTPTSTITLILSPTRTPTPTRTTIRKVKKTIKQQTSFWSWLFGK